MICPLLGHSCKERVEDWQKLWKYRIIICLGLTDDLVNLYCFYRGPEFSSHLGLTILYNSISRIFNVPFWPLCTLVLGNSIQPSSSHSGPSPWENLPLAAPPPAMLQIMPTGYFICSPDLPCGSPSRVSLLHLGSPRNVLLRLNLNLLIWPDLIYYIVKET